MKLNNKGITLIEIIVSIVLISIVLIFLSTLLIDVKDINDKSDTSSEYLINKALITKIVQEDFIDLKDVNIDSLEVKTDKNGCINEFYDYDAGDISDNKNKYNDCIKFELTKPDDSVEYSYIARYFLKRHNTYVISYIHGNDVRKTYYLDDFARYNVKDDGNLVNSDLAMNYQSDGNAFLINIPMLGSDGKDYSTTIVYYK